MHTYQNLRAKMKAQTLSNWSPALRPRDATNGDPVKQFGTGLTETVSTPDEVPPVNQTMWQSFEWYTPSWSTPVTLPMEVGNIANPAPVQLAQLPELPAHYSVIESLLPSLSSLGVTSIWLPPGCKGSGPHDNGYGVYDLYDLGEFDWKGSRRTKWGSKAELAKLGRKAEEVGIGLLWDAVLNHRASADRKEKARAIATHPKDRTIEIPGTKDVVTWSCFDYPARQGKYSSMTYNWRHFSGIDWDDSTHTKAVYKYVGDSTTNKLGWATDVDDELGNYDYLMFADVDYTQLDVQADVLHWATWLSTQVSGLRGMRLDAIKHYSAGFQYQLIRHLRENATTKDWFIVGEYWRADSKYLARHIDGFAGHMHLFDVKLVYNFSDFSAGRIRDLRKIFSGSLVELKPNHTVTFVCNHDTQATQSLAAPVLPWFTTHAYALILLRSAGLPCIFHGDVFGTLGPQPTLPAAGHRLMRLSLIRKLYAYGPQHDFFTHRDCIGWSREGHAAHAAGAGLAVVLNTSWGWKSLRVFVGRKHAGETWTDLMGWSWDAVKIDRSGWGVFRVAARTVGVWTVSDAKDRDLVDRLVWPPLSAGNVVEDDDEDEIEPTLAGFAI